MAGRRAREVSERPPNRPASTPEGRENQLTNYAVNLAEKQLRDGSASSQVITHYLKLASSREQLEQEKLRAQNDMLRQQIASMQSQQKIEELYTEAMQFMRAYSGQEPLEVEGDYED